MLDAVSDQKQPNPMDGIMKKITCVVDNAVQRSSLIGEHGLSFWIESDQGSVLFDTGQSESILLHNLETLGLHPHDLNALVLSHAHYDHTGGLPAILSRKPGLPLYAHSDIFRPRYAYRENEYESIGLQMTPEEVSQRAELHLGDAPVEVLSGLWTTGEIKERPGPEGRSAHHYVSEGDGWIPDPYRDDLSLVMETLEGVVVICGCCHAGLLNTLAHVRRKFQRPIIAVVGGTHLVTADQAYLEHVIGVLRGNYGPLRLYPNHCTGERAFVALANAFRGQTEPCPAGTTITFDG
jgi:7,8-dihydropterin-6-yl-methyl-4-(beta-D-ribofuranosyl)aminobenzene 5'-phosphate synthase